MTSVAAVEGRPTATGVCLSQIRHVVAAGAEWSSPVGPGLSLGLVANGDLDFRLPAERFQRFNGPLGFLLKTEEPLLIDHNVRMGGALVCTHLHVPLDVIADAVGGGGAFHEFRNMLEGSGPPDCRLWRTTPAILALTREVRLCPYVGVVRELYLHGKTFEFLALAIDATLGDQRPAPDGLAAADVERLHASREILLDEFADPPSLTELARRCGLSVTRLTSGFRRLFGQSVTAFLQAHRLKIAYDGLTAGRMTVSQAAYATGYQLSSFSTIFLRRFGVRPSELRKHHL